jgi:pyridinium-3,5-bisthiocarboxylic acid mononucleotide nickel chelatase
MRIAFFDCSAGASGDMILGSLLDAGLSIDVLKGELEKLHLDHFDVQVRKVTKRGIGGSQALITIDQDHHEHHHRHLSDIREIIESSDLDAHIKEQSLAVFNRLAEAEAHVHQTTVDRIHFHEVGAMDAIIDVVGSVAGMAAMGIEKVLCSPLHLGSGTVECAHGTLPVPAPATAELVKGRPVYSTGVKGELLTPTGAAILTTLASDFGPFPPMTIDRLGYGAGTSDPAIPNLLRIVIGECVDGFADYEYERVAVIETNIDDMNPQIYEYLGEKMLAMGALDVFLIPMQMKKNRPATLLTVICALDKVEEFSNFLLTETTTIGLRWRIDNRIKAARSFTEVRTELGVVTFKVAKAGARIINVAPEYDDCKRLALEKGVPLKDVMELARVAASKVLLRNPD